jgi:predicted phage terminase large subunit-like protein
MSTKMKADVPVPRALLDAICRFDLAAFVRRCFHQLAPNTIYKHNWHIDAITYHLELAHRRRVTRLMINMPPRSLKSLTCSVAVPAFVLGHDPTARVICVSYGSDLAIKHANDFRAVVTSRWYQAMFPRMRISRLKNTEAEVLTTQGGFRLATSVEGTLTGRGGDFIIIDDPLKANDALSDPKRESVNDWYTTTLLSRLDDKVNGVIVLVTQRLHEFDLAGTLLRGPERWEVLKFPAIAETEQRIQIGPNRYHVRHAGDVLHEQREPREVLDRYRTLLGSDTFQAQYQQEPVPPGGNMIKRHWLVRYDQPPPRTWAVRVIQSWDTASKEGGQNDWSVCTTWYFHEGKHYLIDVFRDRLNYPSLKAKAIELARRYTPNKILIEDTGVGTGLIAELHQLGLPAIAVKPEANKLTRMSIQSAKFEAGLVLAPKSAPWLPELEAELFTFPGGRHDDQIDSISQALSEAADDSYDTTLSWV